MNNKVRTLITLVALVVVCLLSQASAQSTGIGQAGYVYGLGAEGLYASTLPGPGFYVRWYNMYGQATQMKNAAGNNIPLGLTLGTFATIPRIILVPKWKLLGGADFVTGITPAIANVDLKETATGYHGRSTHIGDPDFTFLLGWHGKKYDLAAGTELDVPLGAWNGVDPTRPGNDEWTVIPSVGATYYFDKPKKTHATFIARTEFHTEKRHQNIKMGDDFHIEGGVGRAITRGVIVGPVGYAEWKITRDSGSDITWDRTVKNHVYAIGPEVMVVLPYPGCSLQLRGYSEFGAVGQTEKNSFVAILTKRFGKAE
jgi:hypothetical protein